MLLEELERCHEAEEHYKKALEASHSHRERAQTHKNYAILLVRESRYAEAEKHARLALEIDKCDPIALDILGDILRDEGYLKDAEGMYLKAFWSRPSSIGPLRRSEIHNDLGWVYSQLKYYDKAKEEFKLARDLDPNNVKAIRSLRALNKVKPASEMSDPQKWLAGGLLGYLAISVYFFYRCKFNQEIFLGISTFLIAMTVFVVLFQNISKFKVGTVEFDMSIEKSVIELKDVLSETNR